MKRYVIGHIPYYRKGITYHEGEIVEIPADEPPNPSWTPVDGKAPAKAVEEPEETGRPRTMADARPNGRKL